MKKTNFLKSLLVAVGLLVGGVSSVWAQASYNHTYTEGVSVAAGDNYFLYNIGAKQFLTNGHWWGTRAVVDNSGRVITLTDNGDGYKIYTDYVSLNNRTEDNRKAGYMFYDTNGVFTDGDEDAAATWIFEPVSVDGYTNAYTIKTDNENYLYYSKSSSNRILNGSCTDDENSYWLLISISARNTACDYSYYLINSHMNAANEFKTWSGSTDNTWDIIAIGGNDDNYVGDKYHIVYDIYQEITENVPNGKYMLHAQTSFTDGTSDPAPLLYANDNTSPVPQWNKDTEASMVNASTAYSEGEFANDVTTVVTDNRLRVGVKMTVATQWVTYDNFVLDYLGTCLINDAVAFTNGTTMTAGTWYYYDIPYSISYTVAAGTNLSAVAYSTDGTQLSASATTSDFANPQTLTAGRYYFKSSSEQTLTFIPADYATDRVEEIYDFTSNTTNDNYLCTSGEKIIDNSYFILSNSNFDMKGRFAGGEQSGNGGNKWNYAKNRGGLNNSAANGTKNFAILNLKANDYVTIKYVKSSRNPNNIQFSGDANVAGQTSGTEVVSETVYRITSDGNLTLSVARDVSIKFIKIATSAPVLNKPTVVFNSMVESEGLWYPKYTFSSTDDGVTFYDGDGNDITSGYTFTTAGSQTVYAGKDGRTNSAKVSFSADKVGMILANTVNTASLNLSDFSGNGGGSAGGSVSYYWLSKVRDSNNTTAIPGLTFNSNSSDSWTILYQSNTPKYIQNRRNGTRTITCSVLNEDRMALLTREGNGIDVLTLASNTASFDQYKGINKYQLFTSADAKVSVTIGTTGYSTFSSPVPLNFAGIDGLTAYVATTVAGGSVRLTSVETAPANTGLILKGTASQEYNIPVTNAAVVPSSNLLVGCIVETTVAVDATSGYNNYVLVNNGGVPEFQSLVVQGATIPAGKAYLQYGEYSADARALSIVFDDDETTGLGRIENSESSIENAVYNLQGQRINSSLRKGLYIKNGKKVIVK